MIKYWLTGWLRIQATTKQPPCSCNSRSWNLPDTQLSSSSLFGRFWCVLVTILNSETNKQRWTIKVSEMTESLRRYYKRSRSVNQRLDEAVAAGKAKPSATWLKGRQRRWTGQGKPVHSRGGPSNYNNNNNNSTKFIKRHNAVRRLQRRCIPERQPLT